MRAEKKGANGGHPVGVAARIDHTTDSPRRQNGLSWISAVIHETQACRPPEAEECPPGRPGSKVAIATTYTTMQPPEPKGNLPSRARVGSVNRRPAVRRLALKASCNPGFLPVVGLRGGAPAEVAAGQ